jgi:hypothetical protein
MTGWDAQEAARLAREAYRYVARVLPPNADLERVGRADRRTLEAERREDFPEYKEALRAMCRAARQEATRRAA